MSFCKALHWLILKINNGQWCPYSVLLHVEKEQSGDRCGVNWMKIIWVTASVIQVPNLNLWDHVSFIHVLPGKSDPGVLWVYKGFSDLIYLYRKAQCGIFIFLVDAAKFDWFVGKIPLQQETLICKIFSVLLLICSGKYFNFGFEFTFANQDGTHYMLLPALFINIFMLFLIIFPVFRAGIV